MEKNAALPSMRAAIAKMVILLSLPFKLRIPPLEQEVDVGTVPGASPGSLAAPLMPDPYPPLDAHPGQQLSPLVPVGGGDHSLASGAGATG